MTQDPIYIAPAAAIHPLNGTEADGLRFVLSLDRDLQNYEMLDDFDGTLGRSGRVLLAGSRSFELVTPAGLLTQTAETGRFLGDLGEGPVRQAISDLSPLRRLLPLTSGQIQTGTLALVDDEGKTQARALLRLLGGGSQPDIALLVPRGLRGYDTALALLRDRLAACGLSDARQLRRHLLPDHQDYSAKPEVGFEPEDTAFDVATDIILAYLPVMQANEPGIIADLDTEFLHDYRVALRKIRSVLSLFRGVYAQGATDEMKGRFSALMAPTGRLRDLDVYLIDQPQLEAMVPAPLQPGLHRMFTLFAAERRQTHAALARHLDSKAYRKEYAALQHMFTARRRLRPGPAADHPAQDLARQLIWKRYRKICRGGASIGADTADEHVHALRIHCKKLRYLLEFFAPAFPDPRFSTALRPLKRLQETLGLFNDYSVQQASLRAFVAGLDSARVPDRLDIAQSVGALIAVLHGRQLAERARVAAGFAGFDDDQTRGIFRELFSDAEKAA